MNNVVKYRVIQITIANLAENIDKVVTFLLKCMQLKIYQQDSYRISVVACVTIYLRTLQFEELHSNNNQI
jgi:hypothetical protein